MLSYSDTSWTVSNLHTRPLPCNTSEESMRIRQGAERDRSFIRKLSARVFARFGEYEITLPVMAGRPGVYTVIAEEDLESIGFAMYTFEAPAVADLLAIAVLPEWQSQGAGKLLLDRVEAEVRVCAGEYG